MTTEPSGESILAKTARGAGWMFAWRMLNRLLGLASLLVLVRLLEPGDFGLVALAFAFYGTIEGCTAIGLENQLARAEAPDRAMYDTAFTLNLLRGLCFGLLVAAIAWPLADYMREPRLFAVVLVLALLAASMGLMNIRIVDFTRQMDFRSLFLLQAAPRLIQTVCAILLAWALHSHWALLAAILIGRAGLLTMSYAMLPYRPRLTLVAWRSLIGVSIWSWIHGVAFTLRERLDNLVVGRVLGPTQVGIYTVSAEIAYLPSSEVVGPICHACAPGFAATLRGEEKGQIAEHLQRILALTALLALPAGCGISLVAGPIVAIALGQAWGEAAALIAVLSIGYIGTAFGMVATALLTANLQLRQMTAVTATAALVRIAILVVMVPLFGLVGVGYGVGLAIAAETVVLVVLAARMAGLPLRRLLPQFVRPLVAVCGMAALLWAVGLGWGPLPGGVAAAVWPLLGGVLLGAASYVAIIAALWWLAGRPAGAEADLLTLGLRVVQGLRDRLPGRGAAAGRAAG